MSVTIEISNGSPRLAIADADGDLHGYRFLVRVGRDRVWSCTLTRIDTAKTYVVREHTDGVWTCDCPDLQFGGPRKRDKDACKHIRAARDLQNLATFLAAENEDVIAILEEAQRFFGAESSHPHPLPRTA